jgi:hypothetical protein
VVILRACAEACRDGYTVLYRLELDGPSMRKLKVGEATELSTPPVVTIAADSKPPKGAKK